jgi:bifunctional non-homologous end joining protein LigD
MTSVRFELEGRALTLSSLERVVWPEAGFTKGEMLDYYARVAPWLLPHLAGRPVTLARFPEGVAGHGWYQTRCRPRPSWVRAHPLGEQEYCLIDDLATLMWAANVGAIEFHPFLARAERIEEPTVAVFDLDPGPPAGLLECAGAALRLRGLLAGIGLDCFPKTSGSVGLHVYVPLNAPHTYAETKPFAREVARVLAQEHPGEIVDRTARRVRGGKVLVDWGQNDLNKSTAGAYSLRAVTRPTVSTPLTWDDVEEAVDRGEPARLVFEPADVLARLAREGDLFRPVLEVVQEVPRPSR